MAGVLIFGVTNKRKHSVDGLFWQLFWEEWRKRCANIVPGSEPSGICTAEFLTALNLIFGVTNKRRHAVKGLFWQLFCEEWIKKCANIDPGSKPSGISTAEFLAELNCVLIADSSHEENRWFGLSWEEWRKRCANIDPGSEPSGISTADFLAALNCVLIADNSHE